MIDDETTPVEWHLMFDVSGDVVFSTLAGGEKQAVRDDLFGQLQTMSGPPLGSFELPVADIEAGMAPAGAIQTGLQAQLDAHNAEHGTGLQVGDPVDGCVYYEFVDGKRRCKQCFFLIEGADVATRTSYVAKKGAVTAELRVGVSWEV